MVFGDEGVTYGAVLFSAVIVWVVTIGVKVDSAAQNS